MSYAFSGEKEKGACLGMCVTYVLMCNNVCNVGRTIPTLCSGVSLTLFCTCFTPIWSLWLSHTFCSPLLASTGAEWATE